jgi:hypothetical protein
VANQNVQDLIAGEVVSGSRLLCWSRGLLLGSGRLLGAGRNSALGHRDRAKTGGYNNDAAENDE